MHQLVYSSRSRKNFSASELKSMLETFRAYNASVGVSGILIYSFGRFLQLIEGEKATVEALFASILKDGRHFDIDRINVQLPRRLFQEWSMGYFDLDRDARPTAGFAGRSPNVDIHLIDEATICEMLIYFSETLTRLG